MSNRLFSKTHLPRLLRLLLGAMVVAAPAHSWAHDSRPKELGPLRSSKMVVFKTEADIKLRMRVYNPPKWKSSDQRPAIVFFHGGGWHTGDANQFKFQSLYLATRGMVAMTAEYRIYDRHKTNVKDCVTDAKSAMRWVRQNATSLGIDSNRIAASGGSAGGHLALALGTLSGFDQPGEDTAISSKPDAMILFNPAVDLRKEAFTKDFQQTRYAEFNRRWGAKPEELSPILHIAEGAPPAILFHGTDDKTISIAGVRQFEQRMKQAGNQFELVEYEGQVHGFFNFNTVDPQFFIDTMKKTDAFLTKLDYLAGPDTIEQYTKKIRP